MSALGLLAGGTVYYSHQKVNEVQETIFYIIRCSSTCPSMSYPMDHLHTKNPKMLLIISCIHVFPLLLLEEGSKPDWYLPPWQLTIYSLLSYTPLLLQRLYLFPDKLGRKLLLSAALQ